MLRTARIAWGAALLLAPARLIRLGGAEPTRPVVLSARALGARHVGEGLWLIAAHDVTPPRWTVAVDAVHATSMLAVGVLSRRLRRDALFSAGCAIALAAVAEAER